MMDRVSIAQLMRPFFLKILNKRLKALLLITQKEHLQGHNLLLNGDCPLMVKECQIWILVLIELAIC